MTSINKKQPDNSIFDKNPNDLLKLGQSLPGVVCYHANGFGFQFKQNQKGIRGLFTSHCTLIPKNKFICEAVGVFYIGYQLPENSKDFFWEVLQPSKGNEGIWIQLLDATIFQPGNLANTAEVGSKNNAKLSFDKIAYNPVLRLTSTNSDILPNTEILVPYGRTMTLDVHKVIIDIIIIYILLFINLIY